MVTILPERNWNKNATRAQCWEMDKSAQNSKEDIIDDYIVRITII